MKRAPGPPTQCLVYRYREDRPRTRGGRRELLCNCSTLHGLEREVRDGLFGAGRYRLEWRDARSWVVRVAAVAVAAPDQETARPGARRVPPPQPLWKIRETMRQRPVPPPATDAPPTSALRRRADAPTTRAVEMPPLVAPVTTPVPGIPRAPATAVPRPSGPPPAPVTPATPATPAPARTPPADLVAWLQATADPASREALEQVLRWCRLAPAAPATARDTPPHFRAPPPDASEGRGGATRT